MCTLPRRPLKRHVHGELPKWLTNTVDQRKLAEEMEVPAALEFKDGVPSVRKMFTRSKTTNLWLGSSNNPRFAATARILFGESKLDPSI